MKLEEIRAAMELSERYGHWPYALMRHYFNRLLKIAETIKATDDIPYVIKKMVKELEG